MAAITVQAGSALHLPSSGVSTIKPLMPNDPALDSTAPSSARVADADPLPVCSPVSRQLVVFANEFGLTAT